MDSFIFRPKYIIPTLDEILSGHSCLQDCGPYNRCNFVQFLNATHCSENFDFTVQIDKFLLLLNAVHQEHLLDDNLIRANDHLQRRWSQFHSVFIAQNSEMEVNIPYTLRVDLHASVLPSRGQLLQVRRVIYELLLDSFNEFISHTRELNHDSSVRRRRLEAVPPESPAFVHFEPMAHSSRLCRSSVADCVHHKELRQHWEKALEEVESKSRGSNSSSGNTSDSSATPAGSRNGSASTLPSKPSSRSSSRGSSITFIVDNIKDYSGWNKTKKIIQRRRSSQESENEAQAKIALQ